MNNSQKKQLLFRSRKGAQTLESVKSGSCSGWVRWMKQVKYLSRASIYSVYCLKEERERKDSVAGREVNKNRRKLNETFLPRQLKFRRYFLWLRKNIKVSRIVHSFPKTRVDVLVMQIMQVQVPTKAFLCSRQEDLIKV